MTNSQLLEWARSKHSAHRFILFENGVRVPNKYGPGNDGYSAILTKDVCNQWTQEADGSWLYDGTKGCDCGGMEKQITDQSATAAIQDLIGAYDTLLAKVAAERAAQKPSEPYKEPQHQVPLPTGSSKTVASGTVAKQPLTAAQLG